MSCFFRNSFFNGPHFYYEVLMVSTGKTSYFAKLTFQSFLILFYIMWISFMLLEKHFSSDVVCFLRISVRADADNQSWRGPDHPVPDSGPLRSHHHVGSCSTPGSHMSGPSRWVRPLQLTYGATSYNKIDTIITRLSEWVTYPMITITL